MLLKKLATLDVYAAGGVAVVMQDDKIVIRHSDERDLPPAQSLSLFGDTSDHSPSLTGPIPLKYFYVLYAQPLIQGEQGTLFRINNSHISIVAHCGLCADF